MNETAYELYKSARQIVKKGEKCCEKDHSGDELFKELKSTIEFFDSMNKGYAERYEKEQENETIA